MVNEGHDIHIGKRIKGYTIQEKLGSGGSACVYLSQNHLHEYTAIKLLSPNIAKSEGQRLFRHEAQILQELQHHQYILPIIDYGKSEGAPYIVTEYTPGGTLRNWINTSRSTAIEKILAILLQTSKAIYAAHLHNIVHNDLKPENILFNKMNEAVLADFGISVRLGRREKLFRRPRGTYAYMAPEQFDGVCAKEVDQYSLGCIAYELLTGRHPFESLPHFNPHDLEIMQERHRSSTPPPPRELNDAIPAHIERAVLTSMAKVPSERHTTIAAFIRALQPSPFLLPQPAYHFTYPLDTPPPYTSSPAGSPAPTNSPDSTAASLHPDQEIYEIVHAQASSYRALRYPEYRHPLRPTLPKNVDDGGIKDTDYDTLRKVTGKSGGTTDRGTRKAEPNPFKTRDLQLPSELQALLSPLLKNLGLKPCKISIIHPALNNNWTYTAIAFTNSESIINEHELVSRYAIIYLPGRFLTTDAHFSDISAKIFDLFLSTVLIIFTNTKTDFHPSIERLIKSKEKEKSLIIGLVKQRNIKELEEINRSSNTYMQEKWFEDYLKPEYISFQANKVTSDHTGNLEEFTTLFLERRDTDIIAFLKNKGSTDLHSVLARPEIIVPNGRAKTIAHNIIDRLNEPPYQPVYADHTLLGEFLCILLQHRQFVSDSSERAKKIRGIIRKYRLGPPTCECCKP